jgi:uncharacterized membrane protein YphA (DoxX/SURF4 family)
MRGLFRSRPSSSWLKELPRLILIFLFVLTAADKAIHFDGFVNALGTFQLLPRGSERFTAIFIITAEFAIALGLLPGRWRRPACLAAVLLLAASTALYLVAPSKPVCGAWFTLTVNTGQPLHIFQNLIFIGLAAMTWLDAPRPPATPDTSSGSYPSRHSAAPPNPTTEDLSAHQIFLKVEGKGGQ